MLMQRLTVLFALASSGCAQGVHTGAMAPHQLLGDPSQYDRSPVVVRGWLRIGPERRHLLEMEPVYPPPPGQACITVELDSEIRPEALRLNDSFVLVEGIFYADLANDRVFHGMCHDSGLKVSKLKQDRN